MLYVFHVDTGTMLTFDMNVAMQRFVSWAGLSLETRQVKTFVHAHWYAELVWSSGSSQVFTVGS